MRSATPKSRDDVTVLDVVAFAFLFIALWAPVPLSGYFLLVWLALSVVSLVLALVRKPRHHWRSLRRFIQRLDGWGKCSAALFIAAAVLGIPRLRTLSDSLEHMIQAAQIAAVLGGAACLWAAAAHRDRVARRRSEGRCVSCSYDLTGNVSGVCPECGAKVEALA